MELTELLLMPDGEERLAVPAQNRTPFSFRPWDVEFRLFGPCILLDVDRTQGD